MANKIVKANKTKIGGVNDKVYTPETIAKQLINLLPIKDTDMVLEPCMGVGSFYNNLPGIKDWCEIDKGRDFFEYSTKVDWIVTNPPYSIFDQFVTHCFDISDNVCLLVPLSKIVSSLGRIKQYKEYGGINKMWILSASRCGFPFGFPCCFVWFQKGKKDSTLQVELL